MKLDPFGGFALYTTEKNKITINQGSTPMPSMFLLPQ
jgi:hypothetical protein